MEGDRPRADWVLGTGTREKPRRRDAGGASPKRPARFIAVEGRRSEGVKKKQKYGTLYYLAMWQGLRGDDLSITLEEETTLTCSITKMNVIFTINMKKYAGA